MASGFQGDFENNSYQTTIPINPKFVMPGVTAGGMNYLYFSFTQWEKIMKQLIEDPLANPWSDPLVKQGIMGNQYNPWNY